MNIKPMKKLEKEARNVISWGSKKYFWQRTPMAVD